MLEYEKKFVLSQTEYEVLRNTFNGYNTKTQVNYYYDTEDFFYNQKGITYRIREKDGEYEATVKTHFSNNYSEEKTVTVKNAFDTSAFTGTNVLLHGCLQTDRKEIIMPNGMCIALDKNTYLDTVDYELEVEYVPQSEALFDIALRTLLQLVQHTPPMQMVLVMLFPHIQP